MAVAGTVFLVWLTLGGSSRATVYLTGAMLAGGFGDAWLEMHWIQPSAIVHTLHAWVAGVITALSLVLAWAVCPLFHRGPEHVLDHGWPSLRMVTSTAVLLLVVQIELGAAYRHEAVGLIPHLLGAPIVALIVMLAASFTLQQFPKHGSLWPMAVAVLIVTSVQVALGLITLVTGMTQTVLTRGSLMLRVAHVMNGSLTLGAVLILAIEVRRKVRRPSQ